MKELLNDEKKLTLINFSLTGYFLLLYLLYRYRIDHVLIGVFRELLTIPFLLAEVFFLAYGTFLLFKGENHRPLFVLSLFVLLASAYFSVSDFF